MRRVHLEAGKREHFSIRLADEAREIIIATAQAQGKQPRRLARELLEQWAKQQARKQKAA